MISGRTDLLAILADPVEQARTPSLLNAALASRGRDAVLVPMKVGREGLPHVVRGLREIRNFRGAVVSMPNKTAIVDLLDEVAAEARQVGACNVVRRTADGRLAGTMYDGEGFVAGLRNEGHDVVGKRVFLAGAGGAASAIAFAMGKHGAAALTIWNRTSGKAGLLAAHVAAAWPRLGVAVGGADPSGHDLAVNATSLGMKAEDPLPFPVGGLDERAIVAEIVIHPATTPLLAEAERRGCAVQHGEPMLAAQIDLMIDFMIG